MGRAPAWSPEDQGGNPGLRTPALVSSLTPSCSRMDPRRGLPNTESHRDLHIWIIEVSSTTRQKSWWSRRLGFPHPEGHGWGRGSPESSRGTLLSQNLQMVPVPEPAYGNFFEKHCYVVLHVST